MSLSQEARERLEQSYQDLRAREEALFNEPKLREQLNALSKLKAYKAKQSVKEIADILDMYGQRCRMHIGHDEHLEYSLQPGTDRVSKKQLDKLFLSFEVAPNTPILNNSPSSTIVTFVCLGKMESSPRGEVKNWTKTKARLCLQLLDDAGGGFWKLEKGEQKGQFKATCLAKDVSELSEDAYINGGAETELMLRRE
ncbi:hypothetical protein BU26DRAFT_514245 [Trematosphaeria pertusa]|uniref:Uncharacterized protein n=1 Tax=Trematosphaeria pertusa TaxID=390896 RepID=A0A6A6IW48_9PLEO|nr:uncharacterized protein BU26DRAFT_514245 [Trematosphaeria pertusa]KAF2254297.1 hypothetical protein BU26DRAFT_514245 [Trematosphaeria pertusa]